MKKALITGITGQDGTYLLELLIEKGYEVHGIQRRSSSLKKTVDNQLKDSQIDDQKLILHYGDLCDSPNIIRIIKEVQPDEIYNLGAMSHVKVSFDAPESTSNVVGIGTLRILEAVRLLKLTKKTKIYQASTSELYGKTTTPTLTEQTPFYPQSPYAVAKLYAHWMTINYREAYNIFACNGILFNHESPLRGEQFVTRKITMAAAKIALGLQKELHLGNLNAKRDWGHAKDYVEAMWRILQYKYAEDWVIATGKTTTVREFVKIAFEEVGLRIDFKGKGIEEVGILEAIDTSLFTDRIGKKCQIKLGTEIVKVVTEYFRPIEKDTLPGDASKAFEKLGWYPRHDIQDLVSEMILVDLQLLRET